MPEDAEHKPVFLRRAIASQDERSMENMIFLGCGVLVARRCSALLRCG